MGWPVQDRAGAVLLECAGCEAALACGGPAFRQRGAPARDPATCRKAEGHSPRADGAPADRLLARK